MGEIRLTRQRRVILEELRRLGVHPTADEIYQIVRQRLPRISLGTVYRNLDILSRAGVIQSLDGAGSPRRFDGTVERHYHIRCVDCGRVEDATRRTYAMVEDAIRGSTHYEILDHSLAFVGVCPQCLRCRADAARTGGDGANEATG